MIERGLADSDNKNVVSHGEMSDEIKSWFK